MSIAKRILTWALRPVVQPLIDDTVAAYHEGPNRDYVNQQVEGAVGDCKEHAVRSVQSYHNRNNRNNRVNGQQP